MGSSIEISLFALNANSAGSGVGDPAADSTFFRRNCACIGKLGMRFLPWKSGSAIEEMRLS